jgi:hypothetical protein
MFSWFPEHATFLLSNLPQLEFLNEIDFRNNKIRDTYYFPVTELANYDLMYEERRVQNQLMESVERYVSVDTTPYFSRQYRYISDLKM